MNLNLMIDDDDEMKPRITVFGVGGAGGNAVNNMIEKQLDGVEFVTANTDAQALGQSKAPARIQIGPKATEGLGAGARPSIGTKAAEESIEEIVDHLSGAHMCFITAGMGGGTGTGAAPIIAEAAREMGILTVGVVTKPFSFEGTKRMRQAEEGVAALQKVVDTLIIIPNQNLFRLANEKTTFTDAFAMADDVLYQGVKGVTDLMVRPGLINLDFADVRSVMDEMGKAMMGTGEATGDRRAVDAAEAAIANPLLDEISLHGAKGVLINITGGYDMTLFELDEAANVIREKVDEDANIIVGSTLDPDLDGAIRVSVVATGIDAIEVKDVPTQRREMSAPLPPVTSRTAQSSAPVAEDVVSDIPAPAYNAMPRPQTTTSVQEDAADFTAPRPAAPRAPSRPAVSAPRHAPDVADPRNEAAPRAEARSGQMDEETLNRVRSASRDKVPQKEPGEAGEERAERQRRRGLSGMMGRLAGHSEATPRQSASTVAQRVGDHMANRQDGSAQLDFDEVASPNSEDDEAQIPAFLRRQAN